MCDSSPHAFRYLQCICARGLTKIGKHFGCTVVAVVGSPHKVEACKKLGADYVIDKSTEDLWPTALSLVDDGFDIILDANGVGNL